MKIQKCHRVPIQSVCATIGINIFTECVRFTVSSILKRAIAKYMHESMLNIGKNTSTDFPCPPFASKAIFGAILKDFEVPVVSASDLSPGKTIATFQCNIVGLCCDLLRRTWPNARNITDAI